MRAVIFVPFLVLATSAAPAELKAYVGAGGAILDGSGAPTISRFELFVPDHGAIADVRAVEIDIVHTWVGDLSIALVKKGADGGPPLAAVTLLDRPGVPQSVFGNSSDLNGLYSFQVGGMPFPEMRVGAVVPPGVYALHEDATYGAFRGHDKFGVWSLLLSDSAGENIGTLASWRLVVDNVPEPTPGVLLTLAVAFLSARRR